jgi:iron(III) transport system permease protein
MGLAQKFNPAIILSIIFIALIAFPFLVLAKEAFSSYANLENLYFVYEPFLNVLLLIVLTTSLALIIGILSAWFLHRYKFPGRSFFKIAILIPLAFPPYILAIIYGYFIEDQLPYFCNLYFKFNCGFEIRNIFGASFIFAISLYPYIYLFTRNYFSKLGSQFQLAEIYNLSEKNILRKIAIPSARPAIIAASILLMMEIIADFGVVSFFGIKAYTSEIYRLWFYQNNYSAAAVISFFLLFLVLIIFVFERLLLKGKTYQINSAHENISNEPIIAKQKYKISFFFLIVSLFTVFIPLFEIVYFAASRFFMIADKSLAKIFFNSFFLSIIGAIVITSITALIFISGKLSKNKLQNFLTNFISLGYAIPGSVVAIAVLYVINIAVSKFNFSYHGLAISSIIFLIYAYQIRFTAVSFNVLKSGWHNVADELIDVSNIYQKSYFSKIKSLSPMLKNSLNISFLLIAIEIIKELPATLILRPFNFDSLATRTYMLASDEMLADAIATSSAIVLINLIPIYFINKIFYRK